MAVSLKATSEWTLWVVAASCALHATEEYLTGWQEWARRTLGIVMPTPVFLAANAVLVVAALLLARVGWRRSVLSVVIPSATLVNAVFFHILPTIPFSSWALMGAARDGVPRMAIAAAFAGGSLMMAGVVLAARGFSDARYGG